MRNRKLHAIVAIQMPDLAIGKDGKDLYSIKSDRIMFMERTLGHTVVMGRKTWEAIPEKYRPLKGRTNVIISKTLKPEDVPEGVIISTDWKKIVREKSQEQENGNIFIIGGEKLYKETLPYIYTLYTTEIEGTRGADVFFPDFALQLMNRSDKRTGESGIKFSFAIYHNHQQEHL